MVAPFGYERERPCRLEEVTAADEPPANLPLAPRTMRPRGWSAAPRRFGVGLAEASTLDIEWNGDL